MARTVRERNKAVVASLTLQQPTTDQGERMDAVRKASQAFAKVIVKNTEDGPEATLAQRHVEQAVFYAVRSVLFNFAAVDPSAAPVKKTAPRKVPAAPAKKAIKRKLA